MSICPDIKVWPYNLIAEAMGITGEEQSNPFDAYCSDLDAVISKAFREVRFHHEGRWRSSVDRALGAIAAHYQSGDQIRPMLKELSLSSKLYYEVLHNVFAQIRCYIYVVNTKNPTFNDPNYVRKTGPRYYKGPQRSDLRQDTPSPESSLLSNTLDFTAWPWNVFKKANKRAAVDELLKSSANADDVGNIFMCLARMVCDHYRQHDAMMTTFYDYFFLQKGSMKQLSLRYGCSAAKVRKDLERVTNCLGMLIDMHRAMWPGQPIDLDRSEIKHLASQAIEDIDTLSEKEYAALSLSLDNTLIVNLCRWLLTRHRRFDNLVITTFHVSQSNKANMLSGYVPRHGVAASNTCRYTAAEAKQLLGLSRDMLGYLVDVPFSNIDGVYIDSTSGRILFILKGKSKPRLYCPHAVNPVNEFDTVAEAKSAFHAPAETSDTDVELAELEEAETRMVTVTIEIPKGSRPAYFIEGEGYKFATLVEA